MIELGAGSPPGVAGPPRPGDPLEVPPPWRLSLAGVAVFALLAVVGFGWARAATAGIRGEARSLASLASLALAPAVGAAALILSGAFLERIGVPLSGAGPPAISGAVALGGYALAYGRGGRGRRGVAERDALAEPNPEVPQ